MRNRCVAVLTAGVLGLGGRAVALERHFLRLTSPAKPLTFNGLRRRLVNGAYMASTLVF